MQIIRTVHDQIKTFQEIYKKTMQIILIVHDQIKFSYVNHSPLTQQTFQIHWRSYCIINTDLCC